MAFVFDVTMMTTQRLSISDYRINTKLPMPTLKKIHIYFFLTQNFIIFHNGTHRGLQKPAENSNISGSNSRKEGDNNNEVG